VRNSRQFTHTHTHTHIYIYTRNKGLGWRKGKRLAGWLPARSRCPAASGPRPPPLSSPRVPSGPTGSPPRYVSARPDTPPPAIQVPRRATWAWLALFPAARGSRSPRMAAAKPMSPPAVASPGSASSALSPVGNYGDSPSSTARDQVSPRVVGHFRRRGHPANGPPSPCSPLRFPASPARLSRRVASRTVCRQ
jgi:hypothetical protein